MAADPLLVVTYAAPTPMIEYIAPDPADDGEFFWFQQACLPQKLVLEELLLPLAVSVLPDAATADGCGGDKTLPLGSCPPRPWEKFKLSLANMQHTGYDSNTDSELWEWVQVEKDEDKEEGEGSGEDEGEGAASCGAGVGETEGCGAV